MVRCIVFFILVIVLIGCDNGEYVSFYDETRLRIKSRGKIEAGVQSGKWSYYDTLGNVYQEGDYLEGLRSGLWTYHHDAEDYQITWETYGTTSGLIFNYPAHFVFVDSISGDNNYIFTFNKDCLIQIEVTEESADTVFLRLTRAILTNYKIDWCSNQDLVVNNRIGHYLRQHLVNEKYNGYLYSYVGRSGSKTIAVKYFYPNSDVYYHNSIFSGIIDHFNVQGDMLIDPLGDTQLIEQTCE